MTDTQLWDIMPKVLLDEMIAGGYIRRHEHPNGDLYGLNYTASAQYEWKWNQATLNCRGIILDTNHNVIARPFGKFFNLGEQPEVDAQYEGRPFEVYTKFDGSLGIHYFWEGEHWIATRGSFESDQAKWATDFYRRHFYLAGDDPAPNRTKLFEIIYPANRVVVDYGSLRKLQHLATIHIPTGETIATGRDTGVSGGDDFDVIKKQWSHLDDGNHEGFVALYNDGHRVKIKFEEYLRRHRLKSMLTNRAIWEVLSERGSLSELVEVAPDEFHPWIKRTAGALQEQFISIATDAGVLYREVHRLPDAAENRAVFAQHAKQHPPYTSLLFSLLDGKDIGPAVWKMIRPDELEYPTMETSDG